MRDIIRQLKADGTAVFLNSHLLSEVEVTCDRVAFIREGRVVRIDTMTDLLNQRTEVVLRVDTLKPGLLAALEPLGSDLRVNGSTLLMMVEDQEAVPAIAQLASRHGVKVYELRPRQKSLEEIFVRTIEAEEKGEL